MNTIVQNNFDTLKATMALKTQLMDILQDTMLSKSLGGNSMSLGELCKEMGEVEQGYIDSFRTFKHNWTYKHEDTTVLNSVAALKAWHEKLDAALLKVITSLSNEAIESKTIERGGFSPNPSIQTQVYRESILIFCAKASIYLRVMNINFPEQWKSWIG